jgi:hypothetical protein
VPERHGNERTGKRLADASLFHFGDISCIKVMRFTGLTAISYVTALFFDWIVRSFCV